MLPRLAVAVHAIEARLRSEGRVFIEEYLQDLRRERFRPRALLSYLRRVARRVREDFEADPGAVRSIWSVALVFIATAFAAAVVMAMAHDRHLAYDFFLRTVLWILPVFTLVTLHVGMLRDRDGYRLSALNVPIVLTLVRIAMVPGIALLLVEGHFTLAFAAFLVAELTDVADGWIARRTSQTTRFGTVLDHLVDIVFHLGLFTGLGAAGLLPPWVLMLAVLRYGILLVGGACLYAFVGPVRIQPTAFGRLTGVVMVALVALLALAHASSGRLVETLGPLTETALGVLLSLTVVQGIVLGWYNLRLMRGRSDARGRVVGDVRWGAP
jgi:phosphatidylglycerophosphate synthase